MPFAARLGRGSLVMRQTDVEIRAGTPTLLPHFVAGTGFAKTNIRLTRLWPFL